MSDKPSLLERATASLPPDAKRVSIIADKAVDALAIIALVLLTVFGKLDAYAAAALIALIAGVNLGQALLKGGGHTGIVLALGSALLEAARRVKA